MSFGPIPLVRRLYQPVTDKDLPNPQTLTASYVTLGGQFAIGHASQMSIGLLYTPAALVTGSRKLSVQVQVSYDPIGTSEANSKWHTVGDQDNSGGTLTEEAQTYEISRTATGEYLAVPWQMSMVAIKARLRVKEDGSSSFGTAQAEIGLLRLV